ncbi:putative urea active transporter 1 [Purpureocillium lavendulum]|uniref:Urea active transporter 1 n=1 Tax=Purpureocillium lavendulum TaxID=1247861 RepID=A0AB34G7Q9_9HYPO|nr:putative urea active transporter 1 [Purpureocillium lavendulum]
MMRKAPSLASPAMAASVNALLAAVGLDPTKNWSYLTVPVALYVCLVPHYLAVLDAGVDTVYDNGAPRSFHENLRRDTSIDKLRKARILRLEGASVNGFETLGFFAAGVLAANHAGLAPAELNALSVGYLLARVAFVVAYAGIRNRRLSWARTALWNVASLASVALWVKAGLKMATTAAAAAGAK